MVWFQRMVIWSSRTFIIILQWKFGLLFIKKKKKNSRFWVPLWSFIYVTFISFCFCHLLYKYRIDMYAYLSNPDYIIILFLSEGILGRKSLSPGGYNGGLMSSFGVWFLGIQEWQVTIIRIIACFNFSFLH